MEEIWKDIEGYEGLYQISSLGRVKSLKDRWGKERIRKLKTGTNGYHFINLSKTGKVEVFMVHRLVAKAFIPNPDNKPEVNHKDGSKQNNCVTNLEWATRSENEKYSYNVLHKKSGGGKGGVNIFTTNYEFITQVESLSAAVEWVKNNTGLKYACKENISIVCRGKGHSAYGYVFRHVKEKT
jgi:hypothetical protein